MSKYNSWLGLNRLEVLKKVLGNTKTERNQNVCISCSWCGWDHIYESEIESVCVADKWYYLKTCGNIVVRKMYQIHFPRWKGSCFFGCDLRQKMRAELNEKIGKGTTDPSHWVLKLYGRLKSDRVTDTSEKSTPQRLRDLHRPGRQGHISQVSTRAMTYWMTQGLRKHGNDRTWVR